MLATIIIRAPIISSTEKLLGGDLLAFCSLTKAVDG